MDLNKVLAVTFSGMRPEEEPDVLLMVLILYGDVSIMIHCKPNPPELIRRKACWIRLGLISNHGRPLMDYDHYYLLLLTITSYFKGWKQLKRQ